MKALNYCAEAIADLSEAIEIGKNEDRKTAFRAIIEMLNMAEVFIMPDGGYICDTPDEDEFNFNLPFPVTACEYKTGSTTNPKRISLCVSPEVHGIEEGGYLIILLDYIERIKFWRFNSYGVQLVASRGIGRGIPLVGGLDHEFNIDIMKNPVQSHISLFYALSCQNVTAERSRQPEKLNAHRVKKGKPPLKDYHVLKIPMADSGRAGHGNGGGGLKRAHLRRGHIRRLSEDRRIWVNATFVRGHGGFVDKSYKVGG